MRNMLTTFLTINHSDEEVVMRGRNLIKLTLGLAIGTIVAIIIWIVRDNPIALGAGLCSFLGYATALVLARKGRVVLAGSILLFFLIVIIVLTIVVRERLSDSAFFLVFPILIGSAVLTPRQIIVTTVIALCLIFPAIFYVTQIKNSRTTGFEQTITADAIVLLIACASISALISHSTSSFLQRTLYAQQKSTELAAELEQINSQLESQIAQRTAELHQALDDQRKQSHTLQESLKLQETLNNTINALSLPLIPIHHDVLVMPLIGHIDGVRVKQLFEQTLREVEHSRARAIILDVTGIALVDTQLARTLVQLAQAVNLLGAKMIIVGIRPEIAQTLVSLGSDLGSIQSAASLQEGLTLVSRP